MRSLGTSTQAFEAYLVAELVFEAAGTLLADNCARGANSYHKLYVTVSRIKYHNGPAQRHPAGSNEHKGNAVRRLGLRGRATASRVLVITGLLRTFPVLNGPGRAGRR